MEVQLRRISSWISRRGDVDDIGEETIDRRISAGGLVLVPIHGGLHGTDEGDLAYSVRPGAEVGELCGAHVALPAEFLDDDRATDEILAPFLVVERDSPAAELVKALYGFDEMTEECITTLFTIGDDFESDFFLKLDRLVDRAVFETLEFDGTQLPSFVLLSRFDQVSWAKQAPHDVATVVLVLGPFLTLPSARSSCPRVPYSTEYRAEQNRS
jgi:hypothetical protein